MKLFISYSTPTRQIVDIKIQFNIHKSARLQLPSWRPGRYEIANYAQYIYPVKVTQGEASVQKITKDCWEVKGEGFVELSYQFYAARMDAGSSWLDENQLYLNFINCIPKIEGQEDDGIEVNLTLPRGYIIACALTQKNDKLYAENYAQLVDSPFIASSSLKILSYTVSDTTFFIHIQGNWTPDEKNLINDFNAFTQTHIDFFGGSFPTKEYHFLLQALPYKHYHGVEHRNSTVITLGPDNEINTPDLYKELVGVCSHELFHTWNVTRIRPTEMTPYDFSKEAYHITGFVTEGLTTYYGDYMLYKCGFFSLEEYLTEINVLLQRHYQNEGRKVSNLIESSMDLWLDGYNIGAPNRKVSIYNEGALCALLLDLRLRHESGGRVSLQHIVLDLWKEFGTTDKGYSYEDYSRIVNTYTNAPDYFEKYILSNEPMEGELSALILKEGLTLKWQESTDELERDYGLKTVSKADKKEIVRIARDSEAETKFMIGDIILNQDNNHFTISRKGGQMQLELQKKIYYFGYFQLVVAGKTKKGYWL